MSKEEFHKKYKLRKGERLEPLTQDSVKSIKRIGIVNHLLVFIDGRPYLKSNIRGGNSHYVDHTKPKNGFGGVIMALRWHVLGLYQREFAIELDMAQETLSAIETAKYPPPLEALEKMKKIFDKEYEKALKEARSRKRRRFKKKKSK